MKSPVTVVQYFEHEDIEGLEQLSAFQQSWHLVIQQFHKKHSRTLPQLHSHTPESILAMQACLNHYAPPCALQQ